MAKSKLQIQKELLSKQKNAKLNLNSNLAPNKLKKVKKAGSGRKRLKPLSDLRSRQYAIGTAAPDSNVHYYKFTGKQTKNWKPVGKQLRDYLYHLIDSGVRTVGSKPQFSNNEDVQQLLNELKLQLKAKMHTIRVPNKRHGIYNKLKAQTEELKAEFDALTQQQLQLEKAIREEERAIESLEDLENTSHPVQLKIQIPEDTLDLPKMVF
ncbi:centromere protein Q-like [Mercenaria mercenaria]|uniref:centromere protein Q-like n=1 Tax=Mercenaria mercenaria TaxID=6596 RepID=UPI00234F6CDF|nr:centromere protein Q-like [Mercenaria mercenaria]